MSRSAQEFERIAGFPGVVGCIDGTHIPTIATSKHPEAYVNRKSFHSIILQGVANEKCLFIDCYAGEAGSVHDAIVFQRSLLGQQIENKIPAKLHIIGDAAYPLQKNLIKPFRDNGHLTGQQKRFNVALSKTRSYVERTFGFLKGRFRRLKMLYKNKTLLVPMVIVSCCVLHIICLMRNDEVEGEQAEDDTDTPREEENVANYISGNEKRSHKYWHYISK